MQTLSQIDAIDSLVVPCPRSSTSSKRLGRAKDAIKLKEHLIKFVKCVNMSSDGTIASYSPTHGHVAIEVHKKRTSTGRMVEVPDINVIISSLPSEKLKIELVTLLNFKVKRGENQDNKTVYFYETLIMEAIMELYAKDTRIVTTSTDFDVGGKVAIGEAANKWFARRFRLKRCFQGSAVLREGTM